MEKSTGELSRIISLGERYFECSLSDSGESRLRDMLAHTTLEHPAIDELRAMMGFRAPVHMGRMGRRSGMRRIAAGIAAAVAVVVSLSVYIIRVDNAPTCVAYANGVRVTDEEEVVRLMMADMHYFGHGASSSTESFQTELGDVARMINDYESMYPEI